MKKRILSLILALSMVLSVLPLGAFAADPPELVMKDGRPDCSNGTKGNGWEYRSDTLILMSGTYDFRYANPKPIKEGLPVRLCSVRLRFNRMRQLPAASLKKK